MIRVLTLGVILLALALFGCEQFEGLMPKQETKKTVAEKAAEVKQQAEPVAKKSAEEVNVMAIEPAEKPAEMPSEFSEPAESVLNETKGSKTGNIIFVAADEPAVGDLPSVRLIMDGGVEIQKGEDAVRLTSKEAKFVQDLLNKIR